MAPEKTSRPAKPHSSAAQRLLSQHTIMVAFVIVSLLGLTLFIVRSLNRATLEGVLGANPAHQGLYSDSR